MLQGRPADRLEEALLGHLQVLVIDGSSESGMRLASIAVSRGRFVLVIPAGTSLAPSAAPPIPHPTASWDGPLEAGHLRMDPASFRASWCGRTLRLTPREFTILFTLAAQPGRAWTFEQLRELAWGCSGFGDTSPVRSAVKRLRRKLTDTELRIESVPGLGFRMDAQGRGDQDPRMPRAPRVAVGPGHPRRATHA